MEYIPLDKDWQFRQKGAKHWRPASVPGNIYMDLWQSGDINNPNLQVGTQKLEWIESNTWEYRCIFVVDEKWMEYEKVELLIESLDTYATIIINGKEVAKTSNMHCPIRLDIKEHIIPDDREFIFQITETNELLVIFEPTAEKSLKIYEETPLILPGQDQEPLPKLSVHSRTAALSFGSKDYPRRLGCGIAKEVKLAFWSQVCFREMYLSPKKIEGKYASINAYFEIEATRDIEVLIRVGGQEDGVSNTMESVKLKRGINKVTLSLDLLHPRLWWPHHLGNAHLYEILGEIVTDSGIIAKKKVKMGIREVHFAKHNQAEGFPLEVNGLGSALHIAAWQNIPFLPYQDRIPVYTYRIEQALDIGINCLLVKGDGSFETEDFYRLCDEMGMMIIQSYMFGTGIINTTKLFESIEEEAYKQNQRLRNHPCLIQWIGNFDNWQKWISDSWKEDGDYEDDELKLVQNLYQKIFRDLLPRINKDFNPNTAYRAEFAENPDGPGPVEMLHFLPSPPSFHSLHTHNHAPKDSKDFNKQLIPTYFLSKQGVVQRNYKKIKKTIDKHCPSAKNLAETAYLYQLYAALDAETQILTFKNKGNSGSAMYFGNMHDAFPACQSGIVDAFGHPKSVYYMLKRNLVKRSIWVKEHQGKLQIYLHSQQETPQKGKITLEISCTDFYGKTLSSQSKKVQLDPTNSTQLLSVLPTMEWLNLHSSNSVVMQLIIRGINPGLAPFYHYFEPIHKLNLPEPDIHLDYIYAQEAYKITLQSKVAARMVQLSLSKAEGYFSDNYFDLYPEKKKIIYLSSRSKNLDLGQDLQVMSSGDLNWAKS